VADQTKTDRDNPMMDEPLPSPANSASAKGYSADPGPERPVPEKDPVPLVPDSEVRGHVKKPDEGPLPPTGRSEPKEYGPNDRLMGSDR
jgi:hypothetical protein